MVDITLAIDPRAAHDRWVQQYTWHLDLVPTLLEVLVDATLPSIPVGLGSRFDKEQLTGGGYRDNMQLLDRFITGTDGVMTPAGAGADATELWEWVTSYTAAVSSWLNQDVPVPYAPDFPPTVGRRVNPDPLSARGEGMVTVGWLIDRAEPTMPFTVLDESRDAMFALIRRLRGRYGVHPHPRRQRPTLCGICGEMGVQTRWVTSRDGRARAVEVKTCSTCGDEHREDEGKSA